MSDTLTLPAETRERAGKGASRALRREGRVPAVVYGGNEEPLAIHVEAKELIRQLNTGHFFNSIVEVEVDGKTLRTLPKDVAFHPVSDRPLHADFLRVAKDATVHVNVPVVFVNEDASPGLKRGGVLNIVRHELELVCDADEDPRRDHHRRDRLRCGRIDPHQPREAAGRFAERDHRSRLHHRHDRCTFGAEEPGRRSERRRRSRSRVSSPQAFETALPAPAYRRAGGAFRILEHGQGFGHHAALGRPRQSRAAICAAPAQCRLHGRRCNRRSP